MEERASLQERKLARSQDFRQRHYALQKQAWTKQVLKCHLEDSNATARFSWIQQQAGGLNTISEPTIFEKLVTRGAKAHRRGVVAAERAQ
ncbi:hypothetical protein AV530_008161 [Patagioenas fasciata monilis]|uniref:Uncharacterized protein n=1 Tax=Patagioenas fasciata monilis TaxID=372326 RepID=A0A1V4KV28_PATFA|nr:hypothetical protein AV530_008161 [Patagioenas fasciata monilis]